MTSKEIRLFINNLSERDYNNIKIDLSTLSRQRFSQKYYNFDLTKKKYTLLLKLFNINEIAAHTFFWVTNGVVDKYVADDYILEPDFHAGRSIGCSGTPGYKWYNNGSNTIYINPDIQEIPSGYVKGSLHKSTLGSHLYNDGINTFYSKELLTDYAKGAIDTTNYKKAASKRKKYYYNNGVEEIQLLESDIVPEGFVSGRLPIKSPEDRIKDRDEYYDTLGYIAVKNLTKSQLNAYRYYRFIENEITDIIYKKDTYTYINKKYLPMFDEYSKVNHSKGVSNMELNLDTFIRSIYHFEISRNNKSIIRDENGYYELDFYLPDKNLAIEFNGNFWHSSEVIPKNYHLNKSKLCENLGIRLIHIYEYEWVDPVQRQKIESLLKIALGVSPSKIFARNCEVKKISNAEAKDFNNKNHLQNHRNAQITYGLFYNGELVQLMSFSKTRYNRNLKDENAWEIIRGCPGSNNIVVGGVSKLFKHFITDYNPDSVFSYCDFNKFDGRGYEAIGMKFCGYTGPDMKWILNDNSVVNRQPSKHKELELKSKAKIFGSGSKKYIWKKLYNNIENSIGGAIQ